MMIYIAGPMSGIPQFNFPAFDAAATLLREQGYDVQSPAEMDSPETRAVALKSPDGRFGSGTVNGETWGDFLARDVKLVADSVEGIGLLPNWETSRGARLETFVALTVGKPVFLIDEEGLIPMDPASLAQKIMVNTVRQGDVSRYGEVA